MQPAHQGGDTAPARKHPGYAKAFDGRARLWLRKKQRGLTEVKDPAGHHGHGTRGIGNQRRPRLQANGDET